MLTRGSGQSVSSSENWEDTFFTGWPRKHGWQTKRSQHDVTEETRLRPWMNGIVSPSIYAAVLTPGTAERDLPGRRRPCWAAVIS